MSEQVTVTISQSAHSVAKARAAQAAAEKALALMIEHVGNPVIREKNGVYESRPSIDIFPNVTWFGQSDPLAQAEFVEYNPATGVGDIWVEVIL